MLEEALVDDFPMGIRGNLLCFFRRLHVRVKPGYWSQIAYLHMAPVGRLARHGQGGRSTWRLAVEAQILAESV
jgi:hypothetical protein